MKTNGLTLERLLRKGPQFSSEQPCVLVWGARPSRSPHPASRWVIAEGMLSARGRKRQARRPRSQKNRLGPVQTHQSAFTLIEIMMVVAIVGLTLAMGFPSIVRAIKREGMV